MQHIIQCNKVQQVLAENQALKHEIQTSLPRLSYKEGVLMIMMNNNNYSYALRQDLSSWHFSRPGTSTMHLCLGDLQCKLTLSVMDSERCHWRLRIFEGIVGKYGLNLLLDSLRALDGPLDSTSRAALHQFLDAAAQLLT